MRDALLKLISRILKKDIEFLKQSINKMDVWDSLKKVEVIFAAEDEYDIIFEEDELSNINTPENFIELCIKKVNN